MPSFRRHPLSWLYFIAAACVTILSFARSREQIAAAVILTGIVYIAGAWAAVGEAHRLARGAVMFIAPLVAALPIYIISRRSDEASAVLAIALIAAVVSYATALVTSLLIQAAVPRQAGAAAPHQAWRFSLSEILGWTVVTAIASVGVSKAEIPAGMEWEFVGIVVCSAMPCSAMIALFLVPKPPCDRLAVVLSAVVMLTYCVLTSLIMQAASIASLTGTVAQVFGVAAIWVLCVRLDGTALAAQQDAQAPALRIHEASRESEG